MKYTVSLLGLSTTVAIALLLPTQAQADTLTLREATQEQPAVLTHEAPQPESGLEAVPAVEAVADMPATDMPSTDMAETDAAGAIDSVVEAEVGEAEASEPAAKVADSNSLPQPSPVIVIEPGDTSQAQDEALQLSASTDSRDLQAVEPASTLENSFPTPLTQSLDMAQTPSESSEKWHFLVVPYIYIPFNISGSATFEGEGFRNDFVGDFTDPSRDFDFTPSQIRTALRNSLNFAFLGAFEAWDPSYKFGVLTNFDYVSLSTDSTVDREVRIPGAANFIPTQINADLTTQLLRADLVGSYRFYDPAQVNPEGVYSEYDLGPFVFDVLGGLSLTQVNNRIGLSTNLGGSGEFGNSRTIVSPLIGGRVRWNANPKLAVVGSGTISGFGISGLMQYGIQGGVDWMFSGNTTLGAGYRFGFLDYNADLVDLNVDQHGPYINIGFRF